MDINAGNEYLVRRINPDETIQDLQAFPRYLEIETVNACNARCPMCTITDWERDHKPMTDGLFDKIATELIEHAAEIKRVSLYRDGEPLIDKKLPKKVATLKDGGVNGLTIATNVSLLTESRSRDLLEAGIDLVIMSIDSLEKEVYESIRKRLNFEEVIENTHQFIDLRNKIRPETSVWVRMIRQPSNDHEWDTYHDYWKPSLSANDRVYYHNINNWGGQLKDYVPFATTFEPSLPCVALWSLLVIFCNGDVPLCNIDFNNKYPTGNVVDHSIAEVWQSKLMNQRRQLHMSGQKEQINLCKNCNVWDEPPDAESISSDYASPISLQMLS